MRILKGRTWGWRRTQYSGQLWNGSESLQEYTVQFLAEEKLRVKISCKALDSSYHVSQGWLRIETDLSLWRTCGENSFDAVFLNDLKRVVNYRVDQQRLVLELGGGAGAMFFSPITDNSG